MRGQAQGFLTGGGTLTNAAENMDVSQEDLLRADLYDFLAALLAAPPSAALLKKAARLEGDLSDLGQAIGSLATVAAVTSEKAAEREFNTLFIGLGRGELVPYASFYLTGFLHEKPLAALRGDMARLGAQRAPEKFEPEDNIASLCEIMAGLIRGRFGDPVDLAGQRDFFAKHIASWAGHFFSDLEAAKASVLYAPVGTIGRIFVEIEREAFRLAGNDPA